MSPSSRRAELRSEDNDLLRGRQTISTSQRSLRCFMTRKHGHPTDVVQHRGLIYVTDRPSSGGHNLVMLKARPPIYFLPFIYVLPQSFFLPGPEDHPSLPHSLSSGLTPLSYIAAQPTTVHWIHSWPLSLCHGGDHPPRTFVAMCFALAGLFFAEMAYSKLSSSTPSS
jgi:hypothetical protein